MVATKSARRTEPKPARVVTKVAEAFTAEEKAAARARVKELKAAAEKVDGESAARSAIAGLPETDRALAERIHRVIKSSAPALSPTTWYGMPAYATADGRVVCHFQPAQKFKTRYATLGFSDKARLDEGNLWPVAFALKQVGPAEEAKIVALLKKAVS